MLALLLTLDVPATACGTAATGGQTDESPLDMSNDDGHDHEHADEADPSRLREWAGSAVPTLHVSIHESQEFSTLLIDVDGFVFTPATVTDPIDGQGHAHLYVDGELLTMIYEPVFDLPSLPDGSHELTVTLSTNDHLEYSSNGEPIGASVMVGTDDGSQSMGHDPQWPAIPVGATIETVHGVVIAVAGDGDTVTSFTVTTQSNEEVEFHLTADATFAGGPLSHIRDHMASGDPVAIEFVVLEDGVHAAITDTDH